MESTLQQFYKNVNLQRYNHKEQKWNNTFTDKVISNYETGQLLFEFSHNVSICNSNRLDLKPPEFDIVIPINTISFFEKVNALWFCYSTKLNIMILCFTSTYTDSLFLVDVNYLHQDPININNSCDGFKVHGGFLLFYQGFRDKMIEIISRYYDDKTKLFISGFSLGGAISTLATLDLHKYTINNHIIDNISHFTFASPRVFNAFGSNHFNSLNISSHRIYNDDDIIPSLPFPIMISSIRSLTIQDFMHIGKSTCFNDNIGNYYDNHTLSYLKYFKLI